MYCKTFIQKHFKRLLKLTIFAILATTFCYFYLISQIGEFMKRSTTFTSRYEPSEMIQVPDLFICMKPGFKQSVAKKFQYPLSELAPFYDQKVSLNNQTSLWKTYLSLSFEYKVDFVIAVQEYKNTNTELKIESVTPIATYYRGMCYLVSMESQIHFSAYWVMKVSMTNSLNVSDVPNMLDVFFTSKESWYGLITNDWPNKAELYLKPVQIDMQEPAILDIRISIKEIHFLKKDKYGTFEEGLTNLFLNSNCEKICFPGIFNFIEAIRTLPSCNYDEFYCLFNDMWSDKRKQLMECLKPGMALVYETSVSKSLKGDKSNGSVTFGIFGASPMKKIEEEVYVISIPAFIGSIGGSLGLFFGFSFLAIFVDCIDRLKIQNK